jgi:gamma-glutamylcyclotransferase (GGCT)/AIG2-like uncharacterized protein YtfP
MTAGPHRRSSRPPNGFTAANRLAVYGSLAPGKANAAVLAPLSGSWCQGSVRGTLHSVGWAAGLGHRAIRLDPQAPEVPVWLFSSPDLPGFWATLDAFEGEDYERVVTEVRVDERRFEANIYRWREG